METVDLLIKDGDFPEQTDLTEPQVAGGWNGISTDIDRFGQKTSQILLGDFAPQRRK